MVKACYLEYDSRQARRDIARLLDPTHELYTGSMFLDQGECLYLRTDLAALDAATEELRAIFARGYADASRSPGSVIVSRALRLRTSRRAGRSRRGP